MLNADLPATSRDAVTEFRDAASCSAWLQTLPLINVGPSQNRILGALEELNAFELAANERLKILEILREPVAFVQAEHAKKFSGKAVPLARQERDVFLAVCALWDAFGIGYRHCIQALDTPGAGGLGNQGALLVQRALWCTGQKLSEHFKAYQDVHSEDWTRLHRLYAFAEARGFDDQSVSHPQFKGDVETTPTETYAHALLLQLANPQEQTPRQQTIVARWLERWVRTVSISPDMPTETEVAPLAVDLAGSNGATHEAIHGEAVRYLNLADVSRSMKKRIGLLRNGGTPESMGLGSDVPATMAASMLAMLYHEWCENKAARTAARRANPKTAELCCGIAAIHYFVTGTPFRQPGEAKELTQKQRDEIATFGRTSTRHEEAIVQGFKLESWTITDESLAGFRLEQAETSDSRYNHHQLVALRPSDAKVFIFGEFRWLAVSETYALRAGVRMLPGVPRGVAVRSTGLNAVAAGEKYIPALALPAVAALHSPATLLLPAGWFRPKRVVEVFSDKPEQLLLTGVIERGSDYERCTYDAVQ